MDIEFAQFDWLMTHLCVCHQAGKFDAFLLTACNGHVGCQVQVTRFPCSMFSMIEWGWFRQFHQICHNFFNAWQNIRSIINQYFIIVAVTFIIVHRYCNVCYELLHITELYLFGTGELRLDTDTGYSHT